MNAFFEGNMATAARSVGVALAVLAEYTTGRDQRLLSKLHSELLRARGALLAADQVGRLERELEECAEHAPQAALRLVKP